MIRLRSIWLRQILLQVLFICMLWGAFSFYFLTVWHDRAFQTLDNQLSIICRGVAGLYDNQAITAASVPALMTQIDRIYREVMSLDDHTRLHYRPVFQIVDRQGQVAYRSATAPATPLLDAPTRSARLQRTGEVWHAVAESSASGRWLVIGAESARDRDELIGSPTRILVVVAIFILFSIVTSWLSLRWGLKPLRLSAAEIAARQSGDFSPMRFGTDYSETRPLVNGINGLLGRLEQNIRREKRLLGDAAHELRTPIAAVLAQLHLLEQAQDPQERNSMIQEMHQGLERAASLSRQLIAIARLEADDFTLRPQQQDLVARIADCISLYYPLALNHQMQLGYDGPYSLWVRIDAQALASILNNLVENSIKYGDAGGQILVSLHTEATALRLQVRDDGPGIAAEYARHVFERFYRVPGSGATGSGLGLAIARALAERMGGSLTLCAGLRARGVGFELRLPLDAVLPPV